MATDSNLIRLSEKLHDGMLWCPKDLFLDSAERAVEEYPKRTKAMAIFYDPAAPTIGYSQCGMTLTEMIKMLSRLRDELIFDLIEAQLR